MADAGRTFLAAYRGKRRFPASNDVGDPHFMRMRAHFARKLVVDSLLEGGQTDPRWAIAVVNVIAEARRTRYRHEETGTVPGKSTYYIQAKATAR